MIVNEFFKIKESKMQILRNLRFFSLAAIIGLLLTNQVNSQNQADNPAEVFDGYKGIPWGTKLDDFLARKNCGNGGKGCIQNFDKRDLASFQSKDFKDKAKYKTLIVLGTAFRDVALSNYLGKELQVMVRDSSVGDAGMMKLPEIFDSIYIPSENVVYVFIQKEFSGALTPLDPSDIKAGNQLMQSKIDKINEDKRKSGIFVLSVPAMQPGSTRLEIKHSKGSLVDFKGDAALGTYQFNGITTGVILDVQEDHKVYGYPPPTGLPLAGRPVKTHYITLKEFSGGLAYFNEDRLKGVNVLMNKTYADQYRAKVDDQKQKDKGHLDHLLKSNPNFQ